MAMLLAAVGTVTVVAGVTASCFTLKKTLKTRGDLIPKLDGINGNNTIVLRLDSQNDTPHSRTENVTLKRGEPDNIKGDNNETRSPAHEDKDETESANNNGDTRNETVMDEASDENNEPYNSGGLNFVSESEDMAEPTSTEDTDENESRIDTDNSEEEEKGEEEKEERDFSDCVKTDSEDISSNHGDKVNTSSASIDENKNIFSVEMNGSIDVNMVNAVRNCKKVQYNELDVIAVGDGVKVYRGEYEGIVETAVKVSPIDVLDMGEVTRELTSLDRKLNKTVLINQKIMSTGNENIVKYFGHEYEFVNQRMHLLIALEQCSCNLHDFIPKRSKLPKVSNNEIYRQLSSGLHFLHSRKIVHRDMKPRNVLTKIEQNGNVVFKLSDFGMAKTPTDSESSTSVSGPCGTYGWMAPEVYIEESTQQPQDVAKRFLKKSDIFPLGQIFYYVASNGRYVFRNQDAIQRDDADYTHIPGNTIPGMFSLRSLLRCMLSQNYMDRPYADEILKHPALWTTTKTLEFFQNASELLEKERNGSSIETDTSNVLRGESWQQYLTTGVEKYLFPTVRGQQQKMSRLGPKYRRKSVQSLIRAVRNNKTHYLELSNDLKKEFGSYPENYLNYWTTRFPQLLMHTYTALGETHSTHYKLKEFYV